MPLTLIVNGNERQLERFADSANLTEVIQALELKGDRIAVEHNGEIAPKKNWEQLQITSGDRLEVVHFVGGGINEAQLIPA